MRTTKNILGMRFGRLVVLSRAGLQSRAAVWECRCDCGAIRIVTSSSLRLGRSRSCGCYRDEAASFRAKTHGMARTPIYRKFTSMHTRCGNRNDKRYMDYGGRGITVCERWSGEGGFERFLSDMGHPPTPRHQIDREDNDGPYSPENCSWKTRKENCRNKRSNRVIEHRGRSQCLSAWCDELGLNYDRVKQRLNKLKWSVERAFSK